MKTVFNTKINRVMKNYSKYICAFVLLLGMSVNAWGLTLTFDFTSNISGWPTSTGTTGSKTYTLDGTDYTFVVASNVYCNSGYLMLKSTTSLGLPAISGKVLTNVSICNSSGCSTSTKVEVASDGSGTDVTGGAAQTFKDRSSVYRYSLSGTSANTMYYLYVTSANCQITYITLTYENSSTYKVTYDAESGTCSKDDDTEDSANAGVTLPSATPNASGWEFAGWATEACDETTTAPRLYVAGETYYPEKAITLHAVYRKMTDGTSTSTATFNASTLSGLTDISKDAYIDYWWVHTASGIEFYIDDYGLYKSNFNLDDSGGDGWALLDAHRRIKQVVFTARYSDEVLDDIEAYDDGSVSVSTSGTTQTVTCSGNVTQLMMVAPSGEESYISSIVVTYYDTKFNSNPCGNEVTLSAGTKTNVSSIAFSSDAVATCSSTDTERRVTVTVTTNTGYKMVDALGFAKTGTVTATKKSGPTGSGPYTYVYEFNQNDNGTATFSATATAKTYTVTLNGNGATSAGSPATVTATYNSNSLSTSITNPSKTGYTFAGWNTKSDGTGYDVISTSGTLNASQSGYTDVSSNWIKDADVELYAKWTINKYKVTLASPTTVTISATSPSIAEGAYAEVNYNSTVTLAYSSLVEGRQWRGWKVTKDADGTNVTASVVSTNTLTVPAYDVTVTADTYGEFVFSCAELTLTAHPETEGAPIFITSTAGKKVRSQGYITIIGNGLTPGTALTFPDLNSKFEVKAADGTAISTDASGEINVNAYIFYTPGGDETTDGLLKITGLKVSVGGAKPKQKTLTYDIVGRHLPTAGYVIAGKKDNKWYALPSDMASTSTPAPSEIAVNDINNPSIAYTAASNIYGLEGPTTSGGGNNIASGNGQYVRLTMSIDDGTKDPHAAPLFGTSGSEDASSSPKIGKSGNSQASSNLSAGWWWELKQTNTSITNPQDAKYTIKCANNSNTLSIKNSPFVWGLYASGVEELRLIPASDIIFAEANFVEWGQHGGVIEVDATGIDATSVVAHLGGNTGLATLTNAGTSGKPATTTKYNYIVDFGDDIDFAAAASNGALLTLEWKKGETVKAMTSLVVPKIIAADGVMKTIMSGDTQWETEVHVLPGVMLEANAGDFESKDVKINQLEIYPGATVKVTKGAQDVGTLKVKTLVLRNGWKRIGGKAYDVARLHVANDAKLAKSAVDDQWYSEWYIDFDQYYPIAVPWPVTVENMSYKNTSGAVSIGPSGSMRLRYYDGNSRATNVQTGVADGANWKQYGADGCKTVPTTLEPSNGYAMTARRPTGKAFSIIRMPLNFTNEWGDGGEKGEVSGTHKDQVDVTAYGVKLESKTVYAEGWNFIANPYMALYQGTITLTPVEGDATTINVVNIPDVDFKEYGQYATATTKLKPSSGFLIQTPATGTITFGTANRKVSAPSYRREVREEARPEQQAYILLSNESAEDMMGIFVSEKYTAGYDLNGDVEKFLSDGTTLRTYMHYGDMMLAYVALTETLAQEWIPVSVRIPSTGEYTFSIHEASKVGELEGIYLIDYANGDQITNLIEENYTFVAEAGTIEGRFAINAKVGQHKVPTDIDIVNVGGDLKSEAPFKFIYNDKAYIYHRGVIYDAMGKRVREINK